MSYWKLRIAPPRLVDSPAHRGSMTIETNLPTLLDTDELAAKLRAPKATLEAWRSQGAGPEFMRIGRKVFYADRDVVAWLNAKKTATSGGSDR